MSRDDTHFDTDLFVLNDPDLAKQIKEYPVGFSGLGNVRIPYNVAHGLVNKNRGSQLRNLLNKWVDATMTPIKDYKKWNPHFPWIEGFITANSDYRTFIKRLKYFIEQLEKNKNEINRVYYGYVNDIGS